MQQFCLGAGLAVDEWIEEFGSGMNLRRRAFLDLVERIEEGRIKRLLVAHKDRLVRFGFEFLRGLRNAMGVRLRWSIRNNSPLSGKWWRL
jgi:predicted site-specific integrase-resolvase